MDKAKQEPKIGENSSNIRNSILFYMALKNLSNKKLRTALTIMGVVIGIGSIFFLLSFGLGIQNLVTKQIIGNQSIKTIDVTSTNSHILKLNNESLSRMKALPHVQKAGIMYSYPGSLGQAGSAVDTITYGVDMAYQGMVDLKLDEGRLLNATDNKSIVLNQAAARAIGFKTDKAAVGKKIHLLVPLQNSGAKQSNFEYDYTVVGVVTTVSDSEVYIPSFLFENTGVTSYSQVRLLTDETSNIAKTRLSVESQGFQTSSPSDTIDQVNQIFGFFNLMLVGFGSISMIVAVLGMFNTLTISLLERTKEIGLMMALGGRSRDMSKLFIIEALLLSVAGASSGILLAVIVGQIINGILVAFAHGRGVNGSFELFATPIWLVLSLVGFMAFVGLVVSYMPARRAKNINPIEALRRE